MIPDEARKVARGVIETWLAEQGRDGLAGPLLVEKITDAILAAAAQQREGDARWHDERAKNTPDAFEMELHQKSAAAIRGKP